MLLLSNNTTLESLASGLQKARWQGDYKFSACCPAHYDKHPSLSVTETNSKILLKCFAGCSQDSVIGALRDLGLWHGASQYQIDRRKRYELKKDVRHHETVLALGIAMSDQGQELSEIDRAQLKKSIQFLQEHANG